MNMLTKQQILLLHTQLIRQSGGTDGVRDEGMLDSAISQPLQTFDNMELYPDIVDKAVRLGYGLITNHPFVDGNKRIGTHAMLVTLDINGIANPENCIRKSRRSCPSNLGSCTHRLISAFTYISPQYRYVGL